MQNLKDMPLFRRIVSVCSVIISLGVVVLPILKLFDVWTGADKFFLPLMTANLLCLSYHLWIVCRKVAYFTLAAAVVVCLCAVLTFFTR